MTVTTSIHETSDSVDKYIRQVVPEPVFSPTQTKLCTDNPVSGDREINIDYNERGARLIHLHSIVLSVANRAAVLTLTDNYGNVLMSFTQQISMNGLYPFDYIINSGQIKLTLGNSAADKANIFFTAQYQYIMDPDFKKKK